MDAIQDVKSHLDIADIVGEYIQLKPAGSGSFKANCPFHQEKTPSFFVNRPRQSWHCFGCNEGGDVISFVQRLEGMEFPEALAHLAEKAGVQLPKFDMKNSSEKKRLQEVNDLAARFFRGSLNNLPQAEVAREYIKKRGLDDLTTDVWRLGYAPDSWDMLVKALKEKDVTEDEMVKAGVVQKSDRGVYDRFRGRLMFPIADVHGNIVGFTARILIDDKKEAKYVNTPETSIYRKSAVLYGLDKAKGEIKRQDLAVICEGNMDVIGSHQFNVTHVVCSSGTALTQEQLNLIKRFTTNLAIAFDADAAGNAATLRGLDLARTLDFSIKVITLPPEAGKDPDDVVRKDPELWKQAITNAMPVVDWLYQKAFRENDAHTPEGKKFVAAALLPEIKRIPNAVERDAWITRLTNDLAVSEESLREMMRTTRIVGAGSHARPTTGMSHGTNGGQNKDTTGMPEGGLGSPPLQGPVVKSKQEGLEERILAMLHLQPDLTPLAQTLLGDYDLDISPDVEHLNYLAIFADREFQDQSIEVLRRELETDCVALRNNFVGQKRARLEQEMRDAELAGDTARIAELIAQFNTLMS